MRAQAPLRETLERNMLLDARLLNESNLYKPILPSLHAAEYRVFSQWGEDGIIDLRACRNQSPELLLPLYRFSSYALGLMKPLPWRAWWLLFAALVRLNLRASADQAHAALSAFYCRCFKSAR